MKLSVQNVCIPEETLNYCREELLQDKETFSSRNPDEAKLRDAQDALERINNGTFGICEKCSACINPDRIKTLPRTRMCIKCASNTRIRRAA